MSTEITKGFPANVCQICWHDDGTHEPGCPDGPQCSYYFAPLSKRNRCILPKGHNGKCRTAEGLWAD